MFQRALWGPLEDWLKVICGFVLVFNGFWMFAPPIIVLASVYLLYTKFLLFFPCVLLYLAWFVHSKDWPECGCMPSDWARTHVTFMAWCADYFNYRIVKTAALPADRNYIVGSHPHGMVCLGMTMSFASNASFCMSMAGITELYKGWKTWTVTLAGQFHWPLRRELLMIGGAGISSKRNLTWILRQEEKVDYETIFMNKLDVLFLGSSSHSCRWRTE
ncbi:hypothetical protein PRIPAC_76861 [Pristionchus pacificus]|uniref:diacylglycerol O-acyltransferase n=1 Tax=Pristionchus pacificus TaxID=54126 RepID=A0A2A6C2J8_PRIPA|nr:hypothetical protein PRIPAC_76861 [Pristionchus pacificus]|eukprot:PDM72395.1 hypothetical protein PRIPAC_38829 [Pristionchus pacificus]